MKRELDREVGKLVGLQLVWSGRALDMARFWFGRQGPEYRLHIQAQWRLVRDGTVIAGHRDWHWPPIGSSAGYRDFAEADAPRSRLDDLLAGFTDHGAEAHVVTAAEGASTGDLRVVLADGCALEVFVTEQSTDDKTDHDEHWRLCPAEPGGPHFVVTAHGIDS